MMMVLRTRQRCRRCRRRRKRAVRWTRRKPPRRRRQPTRRPSHRCSHRRRRRQRQRMFASSASSTLRAARPASLRSSSSHVRGRARAAFRRSKHFAGDAKYAHRVLRALENRPTSKRRGSCHEGGKKKAKKPLQVGDQARGGWRRSRSRRRRTTRRGAGNGARTRGTGR